LLEITFIINNPVVLVDIGLPYNKKMSKIWTNFVEKWSSTTVKQEIMEKRDKRFEINDMRQ